MRTSVQNGLILSVRKFSEADKVVKVMTKDGILELIAKGASKITSKRSSRIEILNHVKMFLAKGKSMEILTDIELLSDLSPIQPEQINLVFYFAELLLKTLVGFDYEGDLFVRVLKIRELLKDFPFHSILILQITLLKELGAFPDLRKDISTHESLIEKRFYSDDVIGYSVNKGYGGDEVSDRIIKIQLFLTAQNNFNTIIKLNLEADDFKKVLRIQNKWLEIFIGTKFNSVKFLGI